MEFLRRELLKVFFFFLVLFKWRNLHTQEKIWIPSQLFVFGNVDFLEVRIHIFFNISFLLGFFYLKKNDNNAHVQYIFINKVLNTFDFLMLLSVFIIIIIDIVIVIQEKLDFVIILLRLFFEFSCDHL